MKRDYLIIAIGLCAFQLSAGKGEWTGYGPCGGIVLTIAIDEHSNLYVGTYGGGVFKSIDRGESWSAINQGLEDGPFIRLLTLTPSNPEIIYAGAETGGDAGLYKSTDAGLSWIRLLNAPSPSPFSMAVDPYSPETLYIGRYCVYRSTDGGETWIKKSSGLPENHAINSLAIKMDETNLIYAGTDLGVYRTINRGESWDSRVLDVNTRSVVIHPINTQVVYVGGSGIYKSIDGGLHWSCKSSLEIRSLVIDPIEPDIIYALQELDIHKSIDGGENWAKLSLPEAFRKAPKWALAIDPNDHNQVYVGIECLGMIKSSDGGETWEVMNQGMNATFISTVAVQQGILFAGFDWSAIGAYGGIGGVVKSADGSLTWCPAGLEGLSVRALVPDPYDPSLLYAVADTSLFKTRDGGENWTHIPREIVKGAILTAMAIDPDDPQVLYLGGGFGLIKSTDGGATWDSTGFFDEIPPSTGVVFTIAINPSNTQEIYIGGEAAMIWWPFVAKSSDGGETFNNETLIPEAEGRIHSLVISPADPQVVYAGMEQYVGSSQAGVWKSTDGGETWELHQIGPYIDVLALTLDPTDPALSDLLYVGAAPFWGGGPEWYCSAYKSLDGGITFEPMDEGLPLTWINSLVVDSTNSKKIYAGTGGKGVLEYTLLEGIEDRPYPVETPALSIRCCPNPFSSVTSIQFSLTSSSLTTLKVYNISGQLVRRLIDGAMPASHHILQWDGRDNKGRRLPAGVYFLRLEAAVYKAIQKVVLMR